MKALAPPDPRVKIPRPGLQTGDPLRYAEVARDVEMYRAIFGNAGYLFAEIQEAIEVLPGTTRARVGYLIKPGPVAVFDTLILHNYRGTIEDSLEGTTQNRRLRSLAPYVRGETLTSRKNRMYIRKLAATGVFTDLRTDVELLADSGSAVILHAGEGEAAQFRAAAFYNGDFGLGGNFQLRHGNVAGTLNSAGIELSSAQEMQEAGFNYQSALLFGRRLDFNAGTSVSWYQDNALHRSLETPSFHGDFRFTGRTGLGKDITDYLGASANGELYASNRLEHPEERRRGLLLNLIQEAELHILDRPFRPTRGFRLSLTWGNGGALDPEEELLVRPERHDWLEASSAWYLPLLPQLTAAFRADGGVFFEEGGVNARRFFLGGASNLRGFGYGDVCPEMRMVPTGDEPVSICVETDIAPAFYLGSAELRLLPFAFVEPNPFGSLRYFAPFSMAVFVDHGAVWTTGAGPRYDGPGVGTSYGFGFRYPLSGGYDMRLDSAWGNSGTGENVFSWVFDMLHAF